MEVVTGRTGTVAVKMNAD